jgi:hypothetical protein
MDNGKWRMENDKKGASSLPATTLSLFHSRSAQPLRGIENDKKGANSLPATTLSLFNSPFSIRPKGAAFLPRHYPFSILHSPFAQRTGLLRTPPSQ